MHRILHRLAPTPRVSLCYLARWPKAHGGSNPRDGIPLIFPYPVPNMLDMLSMLGSTFFNGIVGGKQLGDTLAFITVPVLSRL